MASPNKNIIGMALLGTALGGTLIAIIASLLRRRKRGADSRPDVLNEADPLDMSLHDGEDRLMGELELLEMGDGTSLSVSQRSLSTISHTSTVTLKQGSTAQYSVQQLCHLGNQHMLRAGRLWEEALARSSLDLTSQSANLDQFKAILAKVRELQTLYEAQFGSDVALDTAINALQEMDADYERKRCRSLTSDDTTSQDSFVSAAETADLTDLEERISAKPVKKMPLYEVGLLELQHNSVPYRKLRTSAVGCDSDSEFLAKLHVLRIALDQVMSVEINRKWFMDTGKLLISSIMAKAQRDPTEFLTAMEKMEVFSQISSNFDILKTELGTRGVKAFTLYDVVLDWVLMDAFDDLCNPPRSVLSVVNNGWISNSVKETAISTAVWSILKAKRRLLKFPDGFIAHFYAVSESVSPTLAWAFLGPDSDVKMACQAFRTHCMGFIQDLFNTSKVRYSVYEEMTSDIMKIARQHAADVISALDIAGDFPR